MAEYTLYISIFISIMGVLFQLYQFRKSGQFLGKGRVEKGQVGKNRVNSSFFPGTLSRVKNFIFHTCLQTKLFKAGKIRWTFHFLLFTGFLYLVFVHALHQVTSSYLFDNYEPTLDPYQFLRNLTGLLVLIACVSFLIRRGFNSELIPEKKVTHRGIFSIVLILGLVGTGFLLEASKIVSEPVFMEMVDQYSDLGEDPELVDLKLFWQHHYNLVFAEAIMARTTPNGIEANEPSYGELENGRTLNEEYCLDCHSSTKSAFLSYALSETISTPGRILNRYRIDKILYKIHYCLCLLLLICLPFSRLFHLLLIPLTNFRQDSTLEGLKENKTFIPIASLHGCTNCGYCSRVCSVYPNFQIIGNKDLLPHSKIESVKAMIKDVSAVNLWQLKAGNDECTYCHNCTDICPSGIDLQLLWFVLDEKLVKMGYADNSRFIKETPLKEWIEKGRAATKLDLKTKSTSNLTDRVDTFENCIQCTVCTNVCPVVEYDSSQNDITPHQVMNLLRLNRKSLAARSRMVWSCLNCYSCQEHCPREIRVADILMELRNYGSLGADMIKQPPTTIHRV